MSEVCSSRFVCVSKVEKAALLDSPVPQSTKAVTKFWLSVVADFARDSKIDLDFETIDEPRLASFLEDFYCSLRRKDGSEYKRSSYLAARGAIQRELNRLNRRINIQGSAFTRANKLLDASIHNTLHSFAKPNDEA